MTLRSDPPFTTRDKAAVALMVLAFAVALGLELDIECVGHDVCGLAESRLPQDLSEGTIVKRWIEVLNES